VRRQVTAVHTFKHLEQRHVGKAPPGPIARKQKFLVLTSHLFKDRDRGGRERHPVLAATFHPRARYGPQSCAKVDFCPARPNHFIGARDGQDQEC
jgi:hypothetical protein